MIISKTLIEKIVDDTKAILKDVSVHKGELVEEVRIFELTMKQLKKHPWASNTITNAIYDTESMLYKNIQSSYVGNDPEEDYKQVIVWKLAEMLYITAAVDHDNQIPVKWDVVVYNG